MVMDIQQLTEDYHNRYEAPLKTILQASEGLISTVERVAERIGGIEKLDPDGNLAHFKKRYQQTKAYHELLSTIVEGARDLEHSAPLTDEMKNARLAPRALVGELATGAELIYNYGWNRIGGRGQDLTQDAVLFDQIAYNIQTIENCSKALREDPNHFIPTNMPIDLYIRDHEKLRGEYLKTHGIAEHAEGQGPTPKQDNTSKKHGNPSGGSIETEHPYKDLLKGFEPPTGFNGPEEASHRAKLPGTGKGRVPGM